MALKGDRIALYLSGQPVPIVSCNIILKQPTIKDIVLFKESEFLASANLFGKIDSYIGQIRAGNSELDDYSNFQILMTLINQDKTTKRLTVNFFQLLFPQYQINFDNEFISFVQEEKTVGMINSRNYQDFQEVVEQLFLFKDKRQDIYDPANEKAKKIAEKFNKRKETIAKLKGTTPTSLDTVSLYASYTSILAVGMNMDINILFGYTPFQLVNVFNRYWKKVNSDFYQKVSTTPMMDTSKMDVPDDWTDNPYQ